MSPNFILSGLNTFFTISFSSSFESETAMNCLSASLT